MALATSPRYIAGHRDAQRSAESLFESQSVAQIREVFHTLHPLRTWTPMQNLDLHARWAGGDKGQK